ncbi:MAG: hypothetical protein ACLP9L_27330 [Thermoguttaceae bacterium]
MSIDFYEFECVVMEWDEIKKIVPEEAAVFAQRLAAVGMGMSEFCQAVENDNWDEEDEDYDRLVDEWDKVAEAFTEATTVESAGLELDPRYLDPFGEDAVVFFAVEGVYRLTSAGAKYADMIERKQFKGVR